MHVHVCSYSGQLRYVEFYSHLTYRYMIIRTYGVQNNF